MIGVKSSDLTNSSLTYRVDIAEHTNGDGDVALGSNHVVAQGLEESVCRTARERLSTNVDQLRIEHTEIKEKKRNNSREHNSSTHFLRNACFDPEYGATMGMPILAAAEETTAMEPRDASKAGRAVVAAVM